MLLRVKEVKTQMLNMTEDKLQGVSSMNLSTIIDYKANDKVKQVVDKWVRILV